MITQRSVELHAAVEQLHVRLLEFFCEVLRSFTTYEVVAHHDHEIERKLVVRYGEFVGDLVFRTIACAVVAYHSKLDGVFLLRQLDVLRVAEPSCSETDEYQNDL